MSRVKTSTLQTLPPFAWLLATAIFLAGIFLLRPAAFGVENAACELPPALEETSDMKIADLKNDKSPARPGLDAGLPGRLQTATFAMG